ncbi:hypothetical protein [Helicobacter suis]|uniref:hypothetical protein n=1 Tax=Helicobacter suis TaxID=104628 RepID=UPI0013D8C5AE|nr:hypothetical protein [Helicobacter suis]
MERAIALVGVYELQGLIPEALEVCKSILRNDPTNQQALQMYKRLSALKPHSKVTTTSPKQKPTPPSLSQYAPLQHFQIQNMQTLFIQATTEAELQTIEEWLIRWN